VYRGRGAALMGIVAVAAIAIATGCGDSSEAALTKAQYIKQAEAICKKGIDKENTLTDIAVKERLKGLKDASELELSKAEEERLVENVALPPLAAAIEELAELPVPKSDEDLVSSLIKEYEQAVTEAEDNPGSVLKNPDPFDKPNLVAEEYGLIECSAIS
jgi:hypothetical protein